MKNKKTFPIKEYIFDEDVVQVYRDYLDPKKHIIASELILDRLLGRSVFIDQLSRDFHDELYHFGCLIKKYQNRDVNE